MNIFKKAIALAMAATTVNPCPAQKQITIDTDSTALVLTVDNKGRLHQSYLGKRLSNPADYANLRPGKEAYIPNGINDVFTWNNDAPIKFRVNVAMMGKLTNIPEITS